MFVWVRSYSTRIHGSARVDAANIQPKSNTNTRMHYNCRNEIVFVFNKSIFYFVSASCWCPAQPMFTYSPEIFHNYYYIRYDFLFYICCFDFYLVCREYASHGLWFSFARIGHTGSLKNEQKSQTNGCIELKLFNLSCSNDIEISIHNLNIFESFCIFLFLLRSFSLLLVPSLSRFLALSLNSDQMDRFAFLVR